MSMPSLLLAVIIFLTVRDVNGDYGHQKQKCHTVNDFDITLKHISTDSDMRKFNLSIETRSTRQSMKQFTKQPTRRNAQPTTIRSAIQSTTRFTTRSMTRSVTRTTSPSVTLTTTLSTRRSVTTTTIKR